MGELIQLPLSSEYGCFVPRWFLAPKARQRSLSVHGGEGPEKPQAFCHRGKSPSLKRGFETAVSLQQRGSTGCAHPWRARHLVGGIAAQGDKIWNLGGIDANTAREPRRGRYAPSRLREWDKGWWYGPRRAETYRGRR